MVEFAFVDCSNDADLYVMINASCEARTFVIEQGRASEWRRVIDTSLPSPADFCEPDREQAPKLHYDVNPRAIVVLIR